MRTPSLNGGSAFGYVLLLFLDSKIYVRWEIEDKSLQKKITNPLRLQPGPFLQFFCLSNYASHFPSNISIHTSINVHLVYEY